MTPSKRDTDVSPPLRADVVEIDRACVVLIHRRRTRSTGDRVLVGTAARRRDHARTHPTSGKYPRFGSLDCPGSASRRQRLPMPAVTPCRELLRRQIADESSACIIRPTARRGAALWRAILEGGKTALLAVAVYMLRGPVPAVGRIGVVIFFSHRLCLDANIRARRQRFRPPAEPRRCVRQRRDVYGGGLLMRRLSRSRSSIWRRRSSPWLMSLAQASRERIYRAET